MQDPEAFRLAAEEFARRWTERQGSEDQETQIFWMELLTLLGVANPTAELRFEKPVTFPEGGTGKIDVYLPRAKVVIEQKSKEKRLGVPDRDGRTPIMQARHYHDALPHSEKGRWIIVCNFKEIFIYDLELEGSPPPLAIPVTEAEFPHLVHNLRFLVDSNFDRLRIEEELSLQAGALVAVLQEEVRKHYTHPDSPETLHSLSVLLVRIVFCLYAEDANLFHKHQFSEYIQENKNRAREALLDLFETLDTPHDQRSPYLHPMLAAFPYANGGLFHGVVEIPILSVEIAGIIYDQCGFSFDWSGISPTIFGALFESTLNPTTRRAGGMHYTSIGNILRVIDPLFLDGLREELGKALSIPEPMKRVASLREFQGRISTLTFLDPACGSGNFLTETFIQLRDLENAVLSQLLADGEEDLEPKVSIRQLYGIEVNDFAVAVAKTALWIAQAQKLGESRRLQLSHESTLPLHDEAHIHHANALELDWREVIAPNRLSYIMGNPPFVGYSHQSEAQKAEKRRVCCDEKGTPIPRLGKMDYVACWFYRAESFMRDTCVQAAFISTNSITQGEQATYVWRLLMERGLAITFAYPPFVWTSESEDPAAVHIVIVGFSHSPGDSPRRLYFVEGETDRPRCVEVSHINQYLTGGASAFLTIRSTPLCDVPAMSAGNRATDGGHLLLTEEERDLLVAKRPGAARWIRSYMMGEDFLHAHQRYCLWLVGASPTEISSIPEIHHRVKLCAEKRRSSPDASSHRLAETPHLFREQQNPDSYLAIPTVSSERRAYVPMAFLDQSTIPGNSLLIAPEATLYHFGVLTSGVHMSWMRAVGGRLKSDYSYSSTLVYNNFPWPEPTKAQRAKIEKTAQGILDARALYPNSVLADLYDPDLMPKELRKAHTANDRAVLAAYGWAAKMGEEEIVEGLMGLYREMTEGNSE